MPKLNEKTIRQVTEIIAMANPALGALVPLVFMTIDGIKALRGDEDAGLTEEQKWQLANEARAELARATKGTKDFIANWRATHPPEPENP